MSLQKNQLILIRHLIRYNVLDYESCLELLDIDNTGDKIAISYMFRPLTKYNYISKLWSLYSLVDAEIELFGDYPSWTPNLDSPILNVANLIHVL